MHGLRDESKKEKPAGVWERHAERLRRQAQFERFNQWCLDHPWKSRIYAWGIAILMGEIAMLLRWGLDHLRNSRP